MEGRLAEENIKEAGVTLWSTVLTLRWLRLTLSISGVSDKAVPAPKSSLYWIFMWMRNESIDQWLAWFEISDHEDQLSI